MRNALRLALLPGLLSAAACGGSYPGFTQGVGGGSGGTPVSWSQLAAGQEQTCGMSASGVAYCWGTNEFGEIGDGTTIAVRYTPKAVTGGLSFTALAAGASHSCGISASAAFCWGSNADAQLGDGTTTNRSAPAAVIGGLTFVQLAAGAVYTCGIATSGAAYCWGDNSAGELGVGDVTRRGQPTLVGSFMALSFASVSVGDWSGSYHACGITPAGVTYCWGDNALGELGTGDNTNHTLPVAVTGGATGQNGAPQRRRAGAGKSAR